MYRITVAENSMPTDGKFVEIVGNYNPTDLGQPLVIQKDRVEYWISKGAKPTNTVAKLLNKQGFNLGVVQYHKAPKKVAKPAEAVAAVTVAEKPTEEVPEPTVEEQPAAEVITETTPEVETPVTESTETPSEDATESNSDAGIGVADVKTE
ncbi:MAG: 30S ribosomal protein S16 [Patescibacteria group bacterium]|jgi:small subunit ribosomal protein S16